MGKKSSSTKIRQSPPTFSTECNLSTIQTRIKNLEVGNDLLQIEVIYDLEKARSAILASALKADIKTKSQDLCPHFGVIWPAAKALAEYMIEILDKSFKPMQCLELGCGLGIPSLCLARRDNIQMIASDYHDYVPEFLQRNILRNSIHRLAYQKLDWRLWPTFPIKYPWTKKMSLDFVVGSDLLYEAWQPSALAFALKSLLGSQGTGIIADPGRKHLTSFKNALIDAGLTITDQRLVSVTTSRSLTKVHILTISTPSRGPWDSLEI